MSLLFRVAPDGSVAFTLIDNRYGLAGELARSVEPNADLDRRRLIVSLNPYVAADAVRAAPNLTAEQRQYALVLIATTGESTGVYTLRVPQPLLYAGVDNPERFGAPTPPTLLKPFLDP